jgi:hypothetical protein
MMILDDDSNFSRKSLSEYCTSCSNAVDTALNEWEVVRKTSNAKISHGFINANNLISLLWTQHFTSPPDNLIKKLESLFLSSDLKKHALEWDASFHDCKILGTLKNEPGLASDPLLVQWQFNASPLAGRYMVYVVSAKDESPSANDEWLKRTTYGYASVKDEWVSKLAELDVESTGRVRSMNTFPSCDRITVYKDGRVQLDHLMTTNIGGWVPTSCFNNLFKSALIEANAHESEAMREYVLKLCYSQ